MPYTREKPKLTPDRSVLQQRIPGWGVDLDPKDRPAVPKERFNPDTGAHWDFPERQIPRVPRERSPEHKFLTPVFGTSCPTKGLSGIIRRYAYTLSEGRLSHWLLLVIADRVDVLETNVGDLLRGRGDNPIAEYGLRAELERGGVRARLGRRRYDVKRMPMEALLMTGAIVAAIVLARRAARS